MSNHVPSVKSKYIALISLTLSLLLGADSEGHTLAAHALGPGDTWQSAVMLSDLPASTGGAYVAGDSSGNVYVVWLGNSEGKGQELVDTLYFRHWDGANWSPSVDILAVPAGSPPIRVDTLVMDAFGRLLLLWHHDRDLMLSIADPIEAGKAPGWQTMSLLSGEVIWESDLEAEANGTLDVLAAGQGKNIYYLRSTDAGASWATTNVSSENTADEQVSYATVVAGVNGTLHATWTMNAPDRAGNWGLRGIFYSRSTDQGGTWSPPARVIEEIGHGQSSVFARSDGTVLLFWNHSVGSVDGRYFAISTDAGLSWQPPKVAFENISGISGRAYFFQDSQGQLNLIFPGNESRGIGGQGWYTQWQETHWGAPQPVQVGGKLTGSEVYDARLVGGNHLLYVWTDYDTKQVWFTDQVLQVPARPEVRLPLPANALYMVATRYPADTTPQPGATATQTSVAPPGTTDSNQVSNAPRAETTGLPVMVGIMPAVLLIAMVMIMQIGRRRS